MSDLALIVPIFSLSPLREKLLYTAIEMWQKQECPHSIYIIHLILPGEKELSAATSNSVKSIKYISIRGEEKNRDLWQKEALCNLAVQNVSEENLLIIDGDIYCENPTWFSSIVKVLSEFPTVALQPFENVHDQHCKRLDYSSVASYHLLHYSKHPPHGAGTVWAFRREFFLQMGGFNPLFLDGSGDTGFVYQFIDSTSPIYSSYLMQHSWFRKLIRAKRYLDQMCYLPFDLTHLHHGAERYYTDRLSYLRLFTHPLSDNYGLGENGLLEWKRTNTLLQRVNHLLLKKLNSTFCQIGQELLEEGIRTKELDIPELNLFSLNSKLSLQVSGHNWPFLTINGTEYECHFLKPIGKNDILQLLMTSSSDNRLCSLTFKSMNKKVTIRDELLAADYCTVISQNVESEMDRDLEFTLNPPNSNIIDTVWRIHFKSDELTHFVIKCSQN